MAHKAHHTVLRVPFVLALATGACSAGALRPSGLETVDAAEFDLPPLQSPDGMAGPGDAGIPTDMAVTTDAPGSSPDGSMDGMDGTVGDGGYPPGPYGVGMGSVFQPFQLPDCDGRLFSFAGPDFATARFTVVSLVALWNSACQSDGMAFQSVLYAGYRARGVRIVQILAEGLSSGIATATECGDWRGRNTLAFPVLLDPEGTLQRQYAMVHTYPVLFIVDGHGVIRWLSYGSPHGSADVRAQLETLLAGP